MKHVISIDQGTTGTTVMILSEKLDVVSKHNVEFKQHFPKPGWVEHDPIDIWQSVVDTLKLSLQSSKIDPKSVVAIGITNQRETSLIWEKETGKPVHKALVWQDRRTAELCSALKSKGLESEFNKKTGLVLDPYFSGTKCKWLLDTYPAVRKNPKNYAFGTIDSFLIYKLSGGETHVTDVTNASRTLLMNLKNLSWDKDCCDWLDIPMDLLPSIKSSAEVYATTHNVDGLPDGIPIAGIAGDQQAALFGQACFEKGDTKCTFGTGAFILMNTGTEVVESKNGTLSTCAWQIGHGKEKGEVNYALEGSAFIAGAAVQWLRDGLGLIKSASEIEDLAIQVKDSGGVVFVPALAGLGAPHWRPEARGVISGLTRGTTKHHLARATLEGIALQNAEIVASMEQDCGAKLNRFKVDGGASANDTLMQLQSNVLGAGISRPEIIETTALGAAFLGGLGVGLWESKRQIADVWKEQRSFKPDPEFDSDSLLKAWKNAVAKA